MTKPLKYHLWKLPIFKDSRGSLCAIEWKELPFQPKRSYFLFNTKKLRGGHAHSKEQEVFICIRGSFRARIHDGYRFRTFRMDSPGRALFTANMVWHEFFGFDRTAVMLALSSTTYRGNKGYIMDFEKFLTLCRRKSS